MWYFLSTILMNLYVIVGASICWVCHGSDISIWYILFVISLLFVKDALADSFPVTGKFAFLCYIEKYFWLLAVKIVSLISQYQNENDMKLHWLSFSKKKKKNSIKFYRKKLCNSFISIFYCTFFFSIETIDTSMGEYLMITNCNVLWLAF